MKKTYCDCCDAEITPDNLWREHLKEPLKPHFRVKVGANEVRFRIDALTEGWGILGDDVDLCKYCILNAVRKLDDRPTTAVMSGAIKVGAVNHVMTQEQLDEEKNKHAAEQVKGAGVMILRHLRAMEHDQRGMSPPTFEQCIEAVRVITGCPLP